jgi:hypothetical protein
MLSAQCSNPLACTHPVIDLLEGVTPDGSYLTTQNSSLLVLLSPNTIFRKGASLISLADLAVGDTIQIAFTVQLISNGQTLQQPLTALIVDKFDVDAHIASIPWNEFVTTGGLTVVMDRYTTFSGAGNPQSLADLKVADHVLLIGFTAGNGFYATAVVRV